MAFTLKLTGTKGLSNRNDHWFIDRFVTRAMGPNATAANVAVIGASVAWFFPGWHINGRLPVAGRATSGTLSGRSPELYARGR
jgi:hypothetical protein